MNATVTPLEARETLTAAIARRDPLIVLAGAATSALCRQAVDAAGITASWIDAHAAITFHEILRRAAADLQAGAEPPVTTDDLAMAVSEQDLLAVIAGAVDANRRRAATIVVDEAHTLPRFVTARLLALVELAAPDRGLIVLLAGEPALDAVIDRPECAALRQRITTRLRLVSASDATIVRSGVAAAWRAAMRPGRLAAAAATLVLLAGIGWAARTIARRPPTPRASIVVRPPEAATIPAAPAPQAQAQAPTPPPSSTAARISETGRPSTPETDAQLERLHQTIEREAIDLAGRGDVNGLIALRAKTEAAYVQIGARRPDFLAALLGELDGYETRSRRIQQPR